MATAQGANQRGGDAFASWGDLVGILLIGAGLIAIAVSGYAAASGTGQINGQPDLRAELRYLLPGGAGGLALVVFGTGLLVLHAMRQTRDRVEGALLQLADLLDGLQGPTAHASEPVLVAVGAAAFHVPTCRLVDVSSASDLVTPAEAVARGLAPCGLCKPPRLDLEETPMEATLSR